MLIKKLNIFIILFPFVFFTSSCGYNNIQVQDEEVAAAWSEVLNQYKRRSDLIPNLVNSVKGFMKQEKDVLIKVTEARSRAGSIQASPELIKDQAAFNRFQQAQGELSGALQRLMVVMEKYPDLKSDQTVMALMAQLEGTENRITVARKRYIESVKNYNITIRKFPVNFTAMMFGYEKKANFSVENENEIKDAPAVDLNLE
ncbi:MAG: LemA family protein [Spirochaetia bacterium]|nr:LemA family protein [Spirochaetia bacterium]